MTAARAFAPVSIGNVAAGFDVLGAALQPDDGTAWGDVVEAEVAESDRFERTGAYAHRLPTDPTQDLVLRVRTLFAEVWGQPLPPLHLTLHKNLPISSGLGSSSASVVAAAVAIDAALGHPLDRHALLTLAGRAEASGAGALHLDNVAPCLLGGLQLMTPDGDTRALPWPDDLRFVVASPALELETRTSRGVLPAQVPLQLAVSHAQNLAGLVHALHVADRGLLGLTLRDLLAEPYRAALVSGFRQAQALALAAGALGCSLSGAGPAVFAVAELSRTTAISRALTQGFAQADVIATVRVCRLDLLGARLLP
jgi:homoserine kinase